ncbi:hypothetical protein BDR22DRAFT_794851, partial [Usnea florida]
DEKPRGLTKFMRRASSVLKRDKSKRKSISNPSALGPVSDIVVTPTQTSAIPTTRPSTRVAMTARENYTLQEEKARALFAKYGLTLEPGEWTVPTTVGVPRVEKQVRMRVHRTCHRCQTTFGPDKVCSNCQHTRCKKCPRFPGSNSRTSKGKGLAVGAGGTDDRRDKKAGSLTMVHPATGKEMTRKAPTQRVRRTCHECRTLFQGKATQCENCKHLRCPKCPRDPPKANKYLEGYPGDTE